MIVVEVERISLRNSLHSGSGVGGEQQRNKEGFNFFFFFLQNQIITGKAWFRAKSMGVSYFDRNLPSFTDHVILQIINILSQCIVGNLLGNMR